MERDGTDGARTLTSSRLHTAVDLTKLISTAAQARGVSQVRIAYDILYRVLGPQKLALADYFMFRLFRPDLTEADRSEFVGEREITRLNAAMRPVERMALGGVINSKILTEFLFRGAGLPCSETVAFASAIRPRLPVPVLTGADAIENFLRAEGQLPLFGKPDGASLGIGAASLLRREGDMLVLGDGTRTAVRKLAEEIARDYPLGYLFQRILVPHPDLATLIGPVIGTMRVVSLWLKRGPEPLYITLKLPGHNAMVDGQLSGSNAAAIIDPQSGTLLRAQLLKEPIERELTEGHVTGAPLKGARLPDFDAAINLALNAHKLFPGQGVLGSDVILSDKGPLLNEVNLNPLVAQVQLARCRGLFDETVKSKYREALALRGVTLPLKGVRL